MRETVPRFYQFLGFDYSTQIWGSLRGGILYLPDNMSAYRLVVSGSWSMRMRKDRQKYAEHKKRVEKMYEILMQEIDVSLVPVVQKELQKQKISTLEVENKFEEIKHGELRHVYRSLPIKQKLKINAKQLLHYLGIRK